MLSDKNYPMKPKKHLKIGEYDEACDRAYIVMNFVEEVLGQHSVIQGHKKFRNKVDQIQQALFEIYQVTGGLAYIKELEMQDAEKE